MTSAKEGNHIKIKKRSPYQVMVATPKTKRARSSSSRAKSSTSIKTSTDVLSKEEIQSLEEEIRSLETFENRREIHIRNELLAAPNVISEEKLWNALRRLLSNKSGHKVMKFLKFFRKVLSKESKASAPNMAPAPNMTIETIGGQLQDLNLRKD